jgi:carbon monoxide dehydrogenase subunit G
MKNINLNATWIIKAPLKDVFDIMTDFEKFPKYFPKVADTITIVKRDGNHLEIKATVKSFGQEFPVSMKTEILPEKGYISDNISPKFGTSGHEEFLLFPHTNGTEIKYNYQVAIHKRWLRIFAQPLIGWYSMKFWEKAVIDELKKRVEK